MPGVAITDCEKAVIAAPFGAVVIHASTLGVVKIDFAPGSAELVAPSTPQLKEACQQLRAYFDDPRWPFSLPLMNQGSAYQQRVWQALRSIPPGEVRSYGQLARELNSGPRAVAGACRANEIPIVIPCHRVVAGQGIGGYCGRLSGPFLEIKRWLLQHEGYDRP